jgi:transcriptional regulator GlxA family with amidase domain
LFKEAIGEAVWQYVQRQRLALASELLRTTNHSIAKIAEQAGYAAASHLAAAFKAAFGLTPGKYRKATRV